jgi:glycosyltransferase involved in cell wall biosynthesis
MGEALRAQGFVVEVLDRRPGFDHRCAHRLGRFCRRESVDLIHAHQYAPFLYSALSRLMWHSIPILLTEHGRDYPDYRRPKRVLANRLLLRRKDHVTAVGECVRDALVAYEGISTERIEVVHNGIDLERYEAERPERKSVRRELGVRPDELVVMQVARLNRLKDYPTAIRAMAQVFETAPHTRLVIVGDGEERSAVEHLVAQQGLGERVMLLGTRDDVPRLLQGADVFLLSSITEGIALTLIEAMATGLPCVATRVGGNEEVVVDEETGLVAAPSDPTQLANQLRRLCEDGSLRRRLGEAGYQRARVRFDAQRMHHTYERIYREMTGSAPAHESAGNVPAPAGPYERSRMVSGGKA